MYEGKKNMIKKVVRRNVYVVEMWRGTEFLGYYCGGHRDGVAKTEMDLLKAESYKNIQKVEHMLCKLIKFNSIKYSFRPIECLETTTIFYYDQYDDRKKKGKMDSRVYIRIKDKLAPLSEPGYLCEYHNNKNERSFTFTLDVNKALYYRHINAYSICRALSDKFGEKYEFFRERLYVKEERSIELI